MSVLIDGSISYQARVLFGIIAAKTYKTSEKSNLATVTTRGLGALLGHSPQTISNWLKELESAGHVERVSKDRARGVFRLTSPVFAYRATVETAPNVVAEVESEALPIVRDKRRRCPKCKAVARIASTSGICDECLAEWRGRMAG
jgi:hypothetical protein